jgi:hypothetical protein
MLIHADRSCLIVIDMQERLVPAMQAPARTIRNARPDHGGQRTDGACSGDRAIPQGPGCNGAGARQSRGGRGRTHSAEDVLLVHGGPRLRRRIQGYRAEPSGDCRNGSAYLRHADGGQLDGKGFRGVRCHRCHLVAHSRIRESLPRTPARLWRGDRHHRDGGFRMAGPGRNACLQDAAAVDKINNFPGICTREQRFHLRARTA